MSPTRMLWAFPLVLYTFVQFASAQNIQVNKDNKTIAVTVTEKAEAEAELAEVPIGYTNYGRTKDETFTENVRIANKIVQALMDSGVPKDSIRTSALSLKHVSPESDWPADLRRERQYEAEQSWKVLSTVGDAQSIVDVAVEAGANEVEDVSWLVKNPRDLESEAYAAALGKARSLAEKMAKELGAKVGDLLYASNQVPPRFGGLFSTLNTASFQTARRAPREKPVVKLFPEKVSREATVYAVFAVQ